MIANDSNSSIIAFDEVTASYFLFSLLWDTSASILAAAANSPRQASSEAG